MVQQPRGTPAITVKQESFNNHVDPQMVFSSQQRQQGQVQQPPQQQQQQQQRQQPRQQQSGRPTPLMIMQTSAIPHQYINDDSLAGSSTFADNELAESLGGYGNLSINPFTYASNGNGYDQSYDNEQNGSNTANPSSTAKSYPLRLQTHNSGIYAASPSEFASFSSEFGSPTAAPGPIPFNRARPGQMTSMSMPQFGASNVLQNHAAFMIGAGSLTASPSTPGFVGSLGGGFGEMDGDAAK